MEPQVSNLAEYLNGILKERNLSIRAFATYANLAHTTVRHILEGRTPDHKTLQKLSDYLNVPLDSLYRKADILPPEEGQRQEVIRVIEHLMARLPESDQQEVLQIIRMKVERQKKDKADS
jgi:transcriptional regulator with XRE-family HTH domain